MCTSLSSTNAKEWIEEHVKGGVARLDVSRMGQVPVRTVEEIMSHPEQMRRIAYFDHLAEQAQKKKKLKPMMNDYKGTPEEFVDKWSRFKESRLSNSRQPDHPKNGGDKIVFTRTYAPPASGKPGRLRCANSYQDLYRPFRNRLLEPTCSDLDMVCAAGTFTLWIAERQGERSENLRALVADAKGWRCEFAREAGLSERAAKELLSKVWTCNPAQKCKDFRSFGAYKRLFEEVQEVKVKAYARPEWQWAHQYCDRDNMYGTFFATVLFALEAAVTNECVRFAERKWGWRVQAIVHDGFNPTGKFNREEHHFYLEALGEVAREMLPGIRLKWDWKEFDFWFYHKKTGTRLRELEIPVEWTAPPLHWTSKREEKREKGQENEVEWEGGDEDDGFEGDSKFEPSYELVRREFEKTRCKVNCHYVDTYTNEGDPTLPALVIVGEHQFVATWRHLKYSVKSPAKYANGVVVKDAEGRVVMSRKDVPFLSRWLSDKNIRFLRRFVMRPDGDYDPKKCYNLWKGYTCCSIQKWDRENGKRIVVKFIDFVHHLLGDDREQTQFALDWLSHPYIHPAEKPQVMGCLLGPQGSGKSLFFQVHHNMMGNNQCFVTKNPDKNVFGYNGTACIADKKFINIQEVPPEKIRPYIDGLRPVITDTPLEVKSMGKDPINIDSGHVVGLSSNFLNALNVDSEEERRFWVVYARPYWSQRFGSAEELRSFFEVFHRELKSDDFLGEFYQFCRRRHWVPSRFPKEAVPISNLQKVNREANTPWEIQFFKDLLEDCSVELQDRPLIDLDGVVSVSSEFLRVHLTRFAEKRRWEKVSIDSLVQKMKFMNVSADTPLFASCWVKSEDYALNSSHSARGWKIDLDALRRVMKCDVEIVRGLKENRAAYFDVREEIQNAKFAMMSMPLRRSEMEVKINELESKATRLEEEYAQLSSSVTDKEAARIDEFNAEKEYERVMNTSEKGLIIQNNCVKNASHETQEQVEEECKASEESADSEESEESEESDSEDEFEKRQIQIQLLKKEGFTVG